MEQNTNKVEEVDLLKKIKSLDLINDLQDAQTKINWLYDSTPEDGGTCNVDSVLLNCKGIRQKDIDNFNEASEIKIGRKGYGMWKYDRWINFKLYGQAACRTKGAEAAYNLLKERGYPVSMYYRMD